MSFLSFLRKIFRKRTKSKDKPKEAHTNQPTSNTQNGTVRRSSDTSLHAESVSEAEEGPGVDANGNPVFVGGRRRGDLSTSQAGRKKKVTDPAQRLERKPSAPAPSGKGEPKIQEPSKGSSSKPPAGKRDPAGKRLADSDSRRGVRKIKLQMGSANIPASSLSVLRRLFLWVFKGRPYLIRYFSGYLRPLFLWLKTWWTKPPHDPSNPNCDASTPKTTTDTPYTVVKNGKTISLDGIAASLYPFSNGNIRNTSRSSVRSSQNPSVQSRNASRSRPGSLMSRRTAANSYHVLPSPNLHSDPLATRSHLHPTPRRQWSTSMPQLQTDNDPDPEGSIDIEVTSPISPGNHSQDSLHIPPNSLPFSYEPNVSSPTYYDQTTHEIPPSPVATNNPRSTDQDEHSYRSHTQSHRSISRLSGSSTEERYIRPTFPNESKRYTERTRLPKTKTNLTFPPINLDYSKPSPPDGWVRYAHPEGARYFHNADLHIFTDSEIYDPEILAQVQADYAQLAAVSTTFANPFPPTGEFVINVYRENKTEEELTADDTTERTEKLTSEYYCVDHATRLIFFLKESRSDWMDAWHEVKGHTALTSTSLEIELLAQYWFFVQLYPSAIDLETNMVRELRDIVLHLIGDSMTSPYSTACFPLDGLYKILSLTGELERNTGSGSHGSMCLLARKMYVFNHSRFLNFHGEASARIERDFSVYDDQSLGRKSLLIKTLSFVLFSAPDVHLKNLHKMWVDGIMHKAVWAETMKRLNDEWQEFLVIATVVLNANVAFLAIQSVDIDRNPYRSPAQISSYLSVVANIGSIILGLLLMRQNRTKSRETADEVQNFLNERNHPRLGLESLAILYSLPYALLMWGMVAFLAAFAFTWFQDSNPPTRSLVGSSCCALVILIFWCIYVSWDKKDAKALPERPLTYIPLNDPCEEVVEEVTSEEGMRALGHSYSPFALIGRFLKNSGSVNPRRESYDSEKTAVTPADV
ncbi:hypothetical protein D9619_008039 [Psilocybe cf. subviscida]|uniref:WW domain-containing protein n=1 Tax=Psilocybe cf. subviscida TaxID=2480587 RepID=A0A8H5AUI8_9AGAR|nr:hypothetical protein D9619_008039 [Psilocybe cf. subviscida]